MAITKIVGIADIHIPNNLNHLNQVEGEVKDLLKEIII